MKGPANDAPSIVDPDLELLDPCPDVYALFIEFNTRFFQGRLACCELKWSPRMTTCVELLEISCEFMKQNEVILGK